MNDKEFYKRVRDVFRPETLRRKKVMVIGVGSGGCRVVAEIGRLGVAQVLIERPGELLEEHNIIRHLLGYDWLGRPKLLGVAQYIRNLNPTVEIDTIELDVLAEKEELGNRVEQMRPDLILVCTDNEQSKHAVDEVAVRLGVPVVGAGVYDGGVGGEVYVMRPGAACYGCIAAQLGLETRTGDKGLNLDYNQLNLDEIRSTCALNLDIEQIALIHARVALNLLLAGETDLLGLPPGVNHLVFANRIVPGTFERPLHCDFRIYAKRPDCLVCGDIPQGIQAEADRIRASLAAAEEP